MGRLVLVGTSQQRLHTAVTAELPQHPVGTRSTPRVWGGPAPGVWSEAAPGAALWGSVFPPRPVSRARRCWAGSGPLRPDNSVALTCPLRHGLFLFFNERRVAGMWVGVGPRAASAAPLNGDPGPSGPGTRVQSLPGHRTRADGGAEPRCLSAWATRSDVSSDLASKGCCSKEKRTNPEPKHPEEC